MSNFIEDFTTKTRKQFIKYKQYLLDNDWTVIVEKEVDDEDLKKNPSVSKTLKKNDEFKLQNDLVSNMIERLKYFVKKTDNDRHLNIVKDFNKFCLEIISIHTDRVDFYINNKEISEIKSQNLRALEIKFSKDIFAALSKIADTITALQIAEEVKDASVIEFHENTKIAQLHMHEILSETYPEIKRKIEEMKIDFDSLPDNKLHILNPNPPVWNPDKHYFDQEKETLQYYVDEFKKCKYGVKIDDVAFHPWLYFHMNHFVTEIPTIVINKVNGEEKPTKIIQVPKLRDNEWYIIQESYSKAEKEEKILFIAATRRLFKSTGLASHFYWKAITGGKELLVAGGSAKDLGQLEKNIKVCSQSINPAFAVNNISNDWSKKIPLGIRTKSNKIITQCVIHVINLDGGGDKNSEVLAGFTPDAFAIDEIMKSPFIDQLNGAKPSFDTPNGKLCTPILSGCVCAGTKVFTADGRVVNIEDLKQEDGILGYDGNGFSKEPITWMKPPAKKDCYRITTVGGHSIECSDDHPFLAYTNKTNSKTLTGVRAKDLNKGNKLLMPSKINLFGNRNYKDARLLGLLIGDGYSYNKWNVEIACGEEEIQDYLNLNYKVSFDKIFKQKNGNIYKRARILSLKDSLDEFGILGLSKDKKTLPKNIQNFDKESLSNLLGGYFDADGNVKYHKKGLVTIVLTSNVKRLLEEVKMQLLKFGVHSCIYTEKRNGGYKEGGYINRLYITNKESIINFQKNIKLIVKHKQDKIDEFVESQKTRRGFKSKSNIIFKVDPNNNKFLNFDKTRLNNLQEYPIKLVEYIGKRDVYNLTAGNTHTYLANGFITSNTGGNDDLSRDALIMLNDPTNNDILNMDWDVLERGVPKEAITWKRRNFGTFAPAQMSAKVGMIKLESNLADYLGREDAEELKKIPILLTDWIRCKEIIEQDRKKRQKDKKSLTKEIVYYPIDPEEIFLSGKTNPFPYEEGKRHLDRIRLTGDIGDKVDITRVKNKIVVEESKKTIPEFPFRGGFHDSPIVLFEPLPEEKPPRGLYICALDDYKQEQADSDSLGCFIIYKRQSGNDPMGDRIAAIYTSRPDPHGKFHRWGHMLIEAFNAECLMENEDMEFKFFLDTLKQTERWLVPSFSMAGELTLKQNRNRAYGISPSGNKSAIINKAVNYAKEPRTFINDNGEEETVLGIELINDEMLLEEMLNYKEGENHDRITTFGIALIYAHYLDANYIEAKLKEPEKKPYTKPPQRGHFTATRRRIF